MRFNSGLSRAVAVNANRSLRCGAALAALMVASAAAPVFAGTGSLDNPGFETGDTTGWTTEGGYWTGGWPVPETVYQGQPANLANIVTAGNFDAVTGAPVVFNGNYALKLNDAFGG